MKVQLSTLSNGLRVITTEMPNLISATCKVFVGTGSRHEKDFEPGVSHFLEHMRFKSTSNRNSFDISKEIEILGANVNAYTSKDTTCYYASGLSSSIPKFIEILGDITLNSLFDDADVRTESKVILQEIAMYADDVNNISWDAYYAAAYANHPLALPILGTSDFVGDITRDNLVRYVDEHYFAKNMVLSVAGNIKHDEICALAEKHFGTLKSDSVRDIVGSSVFQQNSEIYPGSHFEQMVINFGFSSPLDVVNKQMSIANTLAGNALGGGMCSPLWQEVREKRGLVYSTYAYYHELPEGNSIIFGAGTTPDNYSELLKTFAEVVKHGNDLVTDDDITRAKNSVLVELSGLVERPNAISSALGIVILEGKELEMPQDMINRVMDFDTKSIRDVIENLKTSDIAIGAAGPVPSRNVLEDFKNYL